MYAFSIIAISLVALAGATPQGPVQPCTTTFTSPAPPFGCTVTVSKHTTTSSLDCHGCVPTTTTATGFEGGPGPVSSILPSVGRLSESVELMIISRYALVAGRL
nr:hypothetical protein CFP56_46810 [Quercus suber]